MKKRLGIFGGTFNPIHNGHLFISNYIKKLYQMDSIVFVPCNFHHEKEIDVDYKTRYNMTFAAVIEKPEFNISEIDYIIGGTTKTYLTLSYIKREYPEYQLYFICGGDAFKTFESWNNPNIICELAKVVVMTRGNSVETNRDVDIVQVPDIQISSTLIRKLVKAGYSIEHLVPTTVRKIIEKEGLYK